MTCSAAHCICKHNIVHNHSCFIAIRSHCSLWPPTAAAAPPKTHAHTPFAFSHQSSLGIRQLLSIVDLTLGSTLLRWRIVAERCLCQERAYPFALATLLYIKYQTSEGQYADLLWPPHMHTRTKVTHPSICTQTRKHTHTHTLWKTETHTHTDAGIQWHAHTQTLRELKSAHIPHLYVPWLFSITAVSLRWCICDIWRHSLYSWALRYNACRREREGEC